MNEVKVIGQMDNTIDHTFESANRVYDTSGISPTLNTCGGGGLQVKILEPIIIGGMQKNQSVKTDGICTTLTSSMGTGGGYVPMITEPIIVASRGRNKENPSDRTTGNEVEQRLEPNSQGICNTLTSVQKDNYVLEPKLIGGLGKKDWGSQWRQGNRVYDSNAVAMALQAGPVGNTGGNSYLYMVDETVKIKQATSQGYAECKVGGVADLSFPNSTTRRGRAQDNGDTSPTLMTTENGIYKIESPYRIRKLTPKEAWRLMGFSDLDFFSAMMQDHKAAVKLMEKYKDNLNGIAIMREAETMQKTSNTQLYRQAGNSIVVNVLEAIFKGLYD